MKNNLIKSLKYIIVIFFWLLVWHFASISIDNNYLFPGIRVTLESLTDILKTSDSYLTILYTAIRVISGFIIGCLLGIMLGLICNHLSFAYLLLNPMFSIIKSTPVASFIVVLWVLLSGDALSVFIGVIMVMPIVWQSVIDGYRSIDVNLKEVTEIYHFSKMKRFKLLTFPALRKYLTPAIITSCGLCWKAEIAAEIIAYTKKSIGQSINDAKFDLNTPTVFAWTIIIIVLSIILEKITKKLLGRFVINA